MACAALVASVLIFWDFNPEYSESQHAVHSPPDQQIDHTAANIAEPEPEQIDYEEWINHIPVHKPEKPAWLPDWLSEAKEMAMVG